MVAARAGNVDGGRAEDRLVVLRDATWGDWTRALEAWCLENGVEFSIYGGWTLQKRWVRSGVEPDECYVFGEGRRVRRPTASRAIRDYRTALGTGPRLRSVAATWNRGRAAPTTRRAGKSRRRSARN